MDNNDLPIIEEYFHKALELPAETRRDFITQTFPDQIDIQQAIMGLLEHADETQGLGKIVQSATQNVFDAEQDLSGTMAGVYKLTKRLKTGGMGAVYIGERADNLYEKKVAVKLIKSLTTSEYLLTRFIEERQILANLEHNNITHLLDGGTTASGTPFLVMEYVEGLPIDQYCEQHRLSVKQRLKLFVKVCEAIQYAHQNLVVHCDIKPENILVNQDGEPKVMDFGISYLLTQREMNSSGPRLLTIQYASPEQILGEAISVSSDIYSLGAVLYKILTGSIVSQQQNLSKEEVLAYIQSQALTRASVRAKNNENDFYKNTASSISTDLDAIVDKALQGKSQDRYSSAADFAADIARFLNQYPVRAHAIGWMHRTSLFLQRNAIASAMGFGLSISLITASAAIWYQSEQVKQQRDIAQQERDTAQTEQQKAQAVTDFITEMFKGIDPDRAQGNEVTVFDMVESAKEKLSNPEQTKLAQQPMVLAQLRYVIGEMYWQIGKIQEATEQLQMADAIYNQYPAQDIELHISTLNALNSAYSRADLPEKRGEILESIVAQARTLYGEHHRHTIGYTLNLGGYYSDTGEVEKAIDMHLQVLEDAKQYLGEKHLMVVLALASLGNNYLRYGDNEASIDYFKQALSLAKASLGSKHTLVIYVLERLSFHYIEKDRFNLSKPYTEELLSLTTEMLGLEHQDTHRAQFLNAKILSSEGYFAETLEILNHSLQTLPAIVGANHIDIINTKSFKAETLSNLSMHQEAILLAQEAIDGMADKYGELSPNTLYEYHKLALRYLAADAQDEAQHLYRLVLTKWHNFDAKTPYDVTAKNGSLYFLHTQFSDFERSNNLPIDAINSLKRAIDVTQRHPEQDYPDLSQNIRLLISLMQTQMPNDSAQEYVEYLHKVESTASDT
ncbi:serine/threonine-protein kinase [Alteromonas sp. M12]|uniref:serine/threonine-protein kinase n=1 Tax=Alteromonas sp. M12 TaxID=3135644 RepID=UPI00319E300F